MAFASGCQTAPQLTALTPSSYPPTALSLHYPKCASCQPFLSLTSKALISIGIFFDDSYYAAFTVLTVRIVKYNASTVFSHRNHSNGLWDIAITASNSPSNPYFSQTLTTAPTK